MSRLPRLLAPLSVAAAFAVAAPAAHAGTTVTFPEGGPVETTVTITDPGPASNIVHLVVTSAVSGDRDKTKVFLGSNGATSPYFAIGVDGVRSASTDADFEPDLSTASCSVYDSSRIYDVPVTIDSANAFSYNLPKGEVAYSSSMGVSVGLDDDTPCVGPVREPFHGLETDWQADQQEIAGIAWDAPATPVVTAAAGRRQVALSFSQELGTSYDVYRVIGGVRDATAFAFVHGNADDEQVVLTMDAAELPLTPGTEYAFQVEAHRQFFDGGDVPTSDFSLVASATTDAVQTVQFSATPAASTTARSAQFSWSMTGNAAGTAPWCGLDETNTSGTEIPCTAVGATINGLSLGAHTLTVYPDYNEGGVYTYTWTVIDVPATPTPVPPVVTAPKDPTDLDGDGITNTWLVGGKAAPAPGTPKVTVTGGKVKLKLTAAPKGAKKIRVYRADGKGAYKLVTTVSPKIKTFIDKKVKPGHTYKYKTVGVNAKGQQGKASKTATATIKKKK